jgi:hypothetical protein
MLGGRRGAVSRPRARSIEGRELARVEHARFAYRARGGADGVGCIDPALRTGPVRSAGSHIATNRALNSLPTIPKATTAYGRAADTQQHMAEVL